ncbi:MAG: methyltransferase domain-containing protein [Candidatus Nanopelagicales bacterium]
MAHDHPIFTQIYRVLARAEDSGAIGRARTKVSAELSGRVLIVGLGPAEDLHHLPAAVTEVVAVEPSASMRRAAATAIARAPMPVEVIAGMGEDLPLPDASVDGVLFAYVLCTVEDPQRVVAEALRVLRPGGTIAVLEHVRAEEGTWMRRAQRVLAPVWPRVAGGCRCDQDTLALFTKAGLDTTGLRSSTMAPVPPVAPGLVGTIRV